MSDAMDRAHQLRLAGTVFLAAIFWSGFAWASKKNKISGFLARRVLHLSAGMFFIFVVPYPYPKGTLFLGCIVNMCCVGVTAFEKSLGKQSEAKHPLMSKFPFDIGIMCYAMVIQLTLLLNVPAVYLLPLFIGDPMAAVFGSFVKRHSKGSIGRRLARKPSGTVPDKTLAGNIAFWLASFTGLLFAKWFLKNRPNHAELTFSVPEVALVVTCFVFVELFSGFFDNFALGACGCIWCYYGPLPAILCGSTISLVGYSVTRVRCETRYQLLSSDSTDEDPPGRLLSNGSIMAI